MSYKYNRSTSFSVDAIIPLNMKSLNAMFHLKLSSRNDLVTCGVEVIIFGHHNSMC